MAPPNIVYLPGLLGSALLQDHGPARVPSLVWPAPERLTNGGLRLLQLAEDEVSPGPLAEGAVIIPGRPLQCVYGPMYDYLRGLGWSTYAVGYDWRKNTTVTATEVWGRIQRRYGQQPFAIIAHSQGGLLARAVWGEMVAAGRDAQLTRLVTLGSPAYGSFEIVRMWNWLPLLYRFLVIAQGWPVWRAGFPGPAYLDAILGSLPGFYELMPFKDVGPLFNSDPTQCTFLYNLPSYIGSNASLTQIQFDNAANQQLILNSAVPANRMHAFAGVGYSTPYRLSGSADLRLREAYLYTDQGDELVTVAQATLPGVPLSTVPYTHPGMMLEPSVWLAAANAVLNG